MLKTREKRIVRIGLSVLIGLFGAFLCAITNPAPDPIHNLGWPFGAVQSLFSGSNPYRYEPNPNYVPYPLTSAFVVGFFALLPREIGIPLFFGVSSAILAYAIVRNDEPWRLLVFLSPSFFLAAIGMQWSPLFMSVLYFPALAWVLIAKPNLAIPVAMSIRWKRLPIIVGAVLTVLSVIVMPTWPMIWLKQIRTYTGFIPVATGLGVLLPLSVLAWKEKEARLLFWMSMIPQQAYWYDQMLLWRIPKTKRQMYVFTFVSWLFFMYVWSTYHTLTVSRQYLILGLYMPSLGFVLCPLARTLYTNRLSRSR